MKFKKQLAAVTSILVLTTFLAGCGTVKTQANPTNEKVLFNGYDNYKYYAPEKSISGSVMNLGRTPVKSYDGNLGYGYDIINSDFFNTGDVRLTNQVLDTDKLADDGKIYCRQIKKNHTYYISGLTATSYESKFNAKVGIKYSGTFFKSSFDSSFNSSEDLTTEDSFEKTMCEIGKERDYINLDMTLNDLKKYVTTSAQVDINGSISPKDLFTKYGTHVMCDIELGGRMEINYAYHNKSKLTADQIDAKATEAYKGISAKEGTSFSQEAKDFASGSEFNANQWGGTTDANISSLEDAQSAYQVWSNSLDDSSNYDFVNIGDMSNPYAFIPIWYFAEDSGRATAIEKEYNTELKENEGYFKGTQKPVVDNSTTYVKNIYFGAASNSNAAESDLRTKMQNADPTAPKVELADYDLNNKAGGDFIYMGYTTTTNKSDALTDVMLDNCSGKKDTCPNIGKSKNGIAYTKGDTDLNHKCGSKSDYIFAYTTKDPKAGSPLIDLGIEYSKGKYKFLTNNDWNGWAPVGKIDGSYQKLDLNKSAGGRDIFMWKRR